MESSFSAADVSELHPLAELTVFRVVQECLNNVEEHSGAGQVAAKLAEVDGFLNVTVQDDGRGFDPDNVAADDSNRGVGLFSMRERTELLTGSLSFQSSPRLGCRAVLSISIKEADVGTDSSPAG